MATTANESAEKIKSGIKATSEKSKETIREIIDSNKKYISSALDSNKKMIDSVRERLNQEKLDDTVTGPLKNAYEKSIELAEDALDGIINSYTRQMELAIDSSSKLLDNVKDLANGKTDTVLNSIQENFEAARQLNIKNTKEMVDFYNKHANLALNFDQKMGGSIYAQIDAIAKIQREGYNKFTEWASDWWKTAVKETAKKARA